LLYDETDERVRQLTHTTLELAKTRLSRMNGAESMRLNAQTRGSASDVNGRSLNAANEPLTMPVRPAAQIIIPRIRLTLSTAMSNSHQLCK